MKIKYLQIMNIDEHKILQGFQEHISQKEHVHSKDHSLKISVSLNVF